MNLNFTNALGHRNMAAPALHDKGLQGNTMTPGLHHLFQRLLARIQHRRQAQRRRRDFSALLGLSQHELNDLAVGRSELPGWQSGPALAPEDLRRR